MPLNYAQIEKDPTTMTDYEPPQHNPEWRQQYPYSGPPPQPPKKRHTGRNIVLSIIGLAAIAIVGGFVACTALVGTAVDQAAKATSDKTVVYEVEANSGSASSVTYSADGGNMSQETNVALPWRSRPVTTSVPNMNAQNAGDGTITCRIREGDKVLVENQSAGQYSVVSCTAPVLGGSATHQLAPARPAAAAPPSPSPSPSPTTEEQETGATEAQTPAAETTTAPESGSSAASSSAPGSSEADNAASKARSYLAMTSFSRTGLIKQLEFDGFSEDASSTAVDRLDINWTAEAIAKGKEYSQMEPFSHSGLVQQLEYDGFTSDQAEAGASGAGV